MGVEWFIVLAAVLAGVAGYVVGYVRGFLFAKSLGLSLVVSISKEWGKSPKELEEVIGAINQRMEGTK